MPIRYMQRPMNQTQIVTAIVWTGHPSRVLRPVERQELSFWRWCQQTSKLVSAVFLRRNKDVVTRKFDPSHVQTPNQGHQGTHAGTKKKLPQTCSHLLMKSLICFRCNIFQLFLGRWKSDGACFPWARHSTLKRRYRYIFVQLTGQSECPKLPEKILSRRHWGTPLWLPVQPV